MNALTLRRLGLLAMLGGALGLAYFPFHAVSYFQTAAGADSDDAPWVAAWSGAFRDALAPAFTFADPDTVYLTYGKLMVFVLAGHLCGIVGLHAWQRHAGGKLMRASYRLFLVAVGLTATAALILNWIPGGLMDAVFLGLALPGLLLMLVAYPLYGAATLRARILPRGAAWLLTLAGPMLIPLVALVGHLGGGMAFMHVAWVVTGRALRRADARPGAQAREPVPA